jgi:L-threonylcarbamoyladenylate synthase
VVQDLNDAVDIVLAAGRCTIGVESTILDLTVSPPALLRHGGIPLEAIEKIIGPVSVPAHDAVNPKAPNFKAPNFKAPGQLQSHYAPHAKVRLNVHSAEAHEALLAFGSDFGILGGKKRLNLSANGDLHETAANLFAMMHELDTPDISAIAVMPIPESGLGLAINDRLRRAAAPREISEQI